jgi:hypothetical protein
MSALPCRVCVDPRRFEIDEALLTRVISVIAIAGQFGFSVSVVDRHKRHIVHALTRAAEAAEVLQGDSLLERFKTLEGDVRKVCVLAFESGQLDTVLRGVREITRLYELQVKATAELEKASRPGLLETSPEWLKLRTTLLKVLDDYPTAKMAVLEALR